MNVKDQIISLLIEHSRLLHGSISDMGVFYKEWAEDHDKHGESLDKKKNKMQLNEEDADAIKIKLIRDFSEVGAQGLGDYVALILRMDNVINSSLEFVDLLGYIGHDIDKPLKKRFHKLINTIIKMASSLKTTIKSLRDKPDDVLDNTTIIHELENDVDHMFREYLNYLYDNEEIEIRLLLRIRDSIVVLEELADRIHDIADHIRILRYS